MKIAYENIENENINIKQEQKDFVNVIHQIREANVTSVTDLEPSLHESFMTALYNLLMNPWNTASDLLSELQKNKGISSVDAMMDVYSWLFDPFTSKSTHEGRIRVDYQILDMPETDVMPYFYTSVTNRLKDMLKKKEVLQTPIDTVVSTDTTKTQEKTNTQTFHERVADRTQTIEDNHIFFKNTETVDTILSDSLCPAEQLVMLLLCLGYETPKDIRTLVRSVSPEKLQESILGLCISQRLTDFAFADAFSLLKVSSSQRIKKLQSSAYTELQKNEKFHSYLQTGRPQDSVSEISTESKSAANIRVKQ